MILNSTKLKGLHLGLSAFVVIVAGLAYGVKPSTVLPTFFDLQIEGNDLINVFRSLMGLYVAFASYWIIGILKDEIWRAATISNVLFMGGLSVGRVVGLAFDGMPSITYVLGLIAEILFVIWGVYNLYYFSTSKTKK